MVRKLQHRAASPMAREHEGRRERVALQADSFRVAEVRRKGDRTHAAGEQLQHGDVQVDEPFEREGDVPVQTVAEPPDAWRLTVGGGVSRDHILDIRSETKKRRSPAERGAVISSAWMNTTPNFHQSSDAIASWLK